MKKLLTADEVADALSVDRATVYRWARAGRLPSYRLGPGVTRFDPDAVDEFVVGTAVGTSTPPVRHMPARGSSVRPLPPARTRKPLADELSSSSLMDSRFPDKAAAQVA